MKIPLRNREETFPQCYSSPDNTRTLGNAKRVLSIHFSVYPILENLRGL
jgi:hypothetical protein